MIIMVAFFGIFEPLGNAYSVRGFSVHSLFTSTEKLFPRRLMVLSATGCPFFSVR